MSDPTMGPSEPVVSEPEVQPPPAPDPAPVAVEAAPDAPAPPTLEERVEVGSVIERTPRGWFAKLHYGGQTRLYGEGATVDAAVREAGR